MEILKFIFSSFWIWLGVTIMIVATLNGLAEAIRELRKK